MANNNAFRNPFLDIQYDLSQNLIINEEQQPDLEKEIRDKAIKIWKFHLGQKVLAFKFENDFKEITRFNYKFEELFEQSQVEIIRDFDDNEVSADIREPLKSKIPKIGREIFKFAKILIKIQCYLSKEIFMDFLNGFCMTSHETVNCERTVTHLIDNTKLKNKYKYALACYFCLEKNILKFHAEFVEEYTLRFNSCEEHLLIMFFTYHFAGKADIFNKRIRECSNYTERNNKLLLNWAIRNENETALYYVFENFSDDEVKKDLLYYIELSLNKDSTNITCYLISRVNNKDILQALCVDKGPAILSKLLFNSRWRNYYKKAADYIHGLISGMRYFNAIKTIIVLWLGKEPDEEERYRKMLNDLDARYQVDINVNYLFNNNSQTDALLMVLLYLEDDITINELLNVENSNELRSLFENNVILVSKVGTMLIENNKLDVFETFVRKTLSDHEIINFKRKFLSVTNRTILE